MRREKKEDFGGQTNKTQPIEQEKRKKVFFQIFKRGFLVSIVVSSSCTRWGTERQSGWATGRDAGSQRWESRCIWKERYTRSFETKCLPEHKSDILVVEKRFSVVEEVVLGLQIFFVHHNSLGSLDNPIPEHDLIDGVSRRFVLGDEVDEQLLYVPVECLREVDFKIKRKRRQIDLLFVSRVVNHCSPGNVCNFDQNQLKDSQFDIINLELRLCRVIQEYGREETGSSDRGHDPEGESQ